MDQDLIDQLEYHGAGDVIFRDGDPGDRAYLVSIGKVGIFKKIDGQTLRLATIGEGGIFGEMAVIDSKPRMAEARALADTALVPIPRQVLAAKLARADPFLRALLTILVTNLRNAPRVYMARPRHLQDFIKVFEAHSGSLRAYITDTRVAGINDTSVAGFDPVIAGHLEALEAQVRDLKGAIQALQDRRQPVIDDDELAGRRPMTPSRT